MVFARASTAFLHSQELLKLPISERAMSVIYYIAAVMARIEWLE